MRRMIMTAVATVSLAAPSAALAHNGERHHHHHRGHHHAHVLAFHAQAPATSNSGTTSPSSTPATGDTAGTIASFTNGVLTITLNDGSTVSGKVTERTEIECAAPSSAAPAPSSSSFGEHQHGDDGHFDNSNDGSNSGNDGQGNCPGHEGDGAQNEHCTSAALVPGASVKEAFLSVSSDGATWVKVEL
jgi:hypothetical protein